MSPMSDILSLRREADPGPSRALVGVVARGELLRLAFAAGFDDGWNHREPDWHYVAKVVGMARRCVRLRELGDGFALGLFLGWLAS